MSGFLDPIVFRGRLNEAYYYGDSLRKKNHGCLAYLINKKSAAALIEDKIITLADDHVYFSRRLGISHLRPLMFIERPGLNSSITGGRRSAGKLREVRKILSRSISAVPKLIKVIIASKDNI